MARISSVPTVLDQCVEMTQGVRFLQATILEYGTLDPVVRDLCRLKSAHLTGCKV